MKKRIIKTHFRTQFTNYNETGKIMDASILTLPDQNLSIRELLDKHSRGIPLGVTENKGEYFDTEIPKAMDLLDIPKFKKDIQAREKLLTQQIQQEQKAAAEAAEAAKPKPEKTPV